jgi:hypothetical protein
MNAAAQKRRYRLYVDESGDHTYNPLAADQWDKRHLCLFGCAIDLDHYQRQCRPAFHEFKARHFGSDPDDPVILHREDIRARRGPFGILTDTEKAKAFDTELLGLLQETAFRAFAVVVDKHATQGKTYGPLPSHPYHIGLLAMMERYCGWLNFSGDEGDVLAESRGGREDHQLKAAYGTVHKSGTRFRSAEFFQKVLTSKELKLKPKVHNIAGLQIADLLAYAAKRRLLFEAKAGPALTGYTSQVAELLEPKYNRHVYSGRTWGYGKIFLG